MAGKATSEDEISSRIRAWLREAMEDRGYDKATMARALGVDDGNYGRLLTGERKKFTAGMVVAVAKLCQISPTRLLHTNPPARFFKGEEPPKELD
jgi:transcriptional regulator with XRE-family HTH domain